MVVQLIMFGAAFAWGILCLIVDIQSSSSKNLARELRELRQLDRASKKSTEEYLARRFPIK